MAQPSNNLNSLLVEADATLASEDYAKAETLYKQVISLRAAQNNNDQTMAMREMYNLSVALLKQGKKSEARTQLNVLLPLLEARDTPDNETKKDYFRQQEEGARLLLELTT